MIEPVVKSVWVAVSPEKAFRRFTDEIDGWWPRSTHSVSEGRCVAVRFEGEEGGRLVEEDQDGTVHPWGDVRAWDPPRRLVFGWHPGREPSTAQEVEVTFTGESGGTRVRLVHRGWDVLGPEGRETRDGYEGGWTRVLGLYVESLDGGPDPAAS